MNKFRKLIIIASVTASSAVLSACGNIISKEDFESKMNQFSNIVKQDMIDVGMDIYHLKLSADYYTTTGDKGEFLSLPSASIIHDITQGKQLAYISYLISEDDYNVVKNLAKTDTYAHQSGSRDYTGDFDILMDIVQKDSSILYSVKNMTTDKMLYSYEQAQTKQKSYSTEVSSNNIYCKY